MQFKLLLSIILLFLTQFRIFAQQDSLLLYIETDKIIESEDSGDTIAKNPIRALLFSACLPGLGQAYNTKYWKIPIIYSALGGVGYSVSFYNKQYQKYLKGLEEILRKETDPTVQLTIFDETTDKQTVIQYKETFRRNRDLSALAFLAVYALNIIDATVDAHLSDFDISDDLTLNITPEIYNSPVIQNTNYFCLTFSIKIK
jgi:hypothetical protein